MKPSSKKEITATAPSAVANNKGSSVQPSVTPRADCETVSRRYQAQVLGITVLGVVAFVVFIKYVVTKYFTEVEAIKYQHSEF